jgi:membrane associated rhomboid family serine protease
VAAVLGAFFVLYPHARIRTLVLWFMVPIRAWFFLGAWFANQLYEAHFALINPASTGGIAFFAHVGGFAFGLIVTLILRQAGRVIPLSASY